MFPVLPESTRGASKEAPLSNFATDHYLIAAGGVEPEPSLLESLIGPFRKTIAADGGYRLLQAMNLSCDLLVGDFDTLGTDELEAARAAGVEVKSYPADKNQSDLEIAVDEAHRAGAKWLSIVGALGGEWDHCLLNLIAPLSLCAKYGIWARLVTHDCEIYLVEQAVELHQLRDSRVSLACLSQTVEDITLSGFRYPLVKAQLHRHQTRGLANQVLDSSASLEMGEGSLLLTVRNNQFVKFEGKGP